MVLYCDGGGGAGLKIAGRLNEKWREVGRAKNLLGAPKPHQHYLLLTDAVTTSKLIMNNHAMLPLQIIALAVPANMTGISSEFCETHATHSLETRGNWKAFYPPKHSSSGSFVDNKLLLASSIPCEYLTSPSFQ
jgi:hypothetical protein